MYLLLLRVAVSVCALALYGTASAGLFRAYLSAKGDDNNPCSVSAPCRLLPAALSAVNDGGEIWMLDSANFNVGNVAITKSVTISAVPGAQGSVVGLNGVALEIVGSGIEVHLRNLTVLNLSNGSLGVYLRSGDVLSLDKCRIHGFPIGLMVNREIVASVVPPANVSIAASEFYDNEHAIVFNDAIRATISHTHVFRNIDGIVVAPIAAPAAGSLLAITSISDSVINGNLLGVVANSGVNRTAKVIVNRSEVSNNESAGFQTGGNGRSVMVISNSVAVGNAIGLQNVAGTMRLTGTNVVTENSEADTSGTITTQPML